MEELKQVLNAELDPDFQQKKKEAKQKKGFVPTHTKIINHIAKNAIEVYEVETGAEYVMEFLIFLRIVRAMDFTEKQVDMAISKILNGYYTIVDFDRKNVMFYDVDTKFKPIGADITKAKEEHTGKFAGEEEDIGDYNPQEFREWYNYINKT